MTRRIEGGGRKSKRGKEDEKEEAFLEFVRLG